MIDLVSTAFIDSIAMSILHSFWQGAVIILVLICTERMQIFNASRTRHFIYLVGLTLLFLSFILSFSWYYFQNTGQEVGSAIPNSSDFISAISIQWSNDEVAIHWQKIIVQGWFLGSLFFLFRSIRGLIKLQLLRSNALHAANPYYRTLQSICTKVGLQKHVELLITDKMTVPFVLGFFKPAILLPACYLTQLTPKQLEAILLHEVIHIKRYDFVINLIQSFIEVALYFNPATWFISNRIRRYREYACDDSVNQNIGSTKDYIEALYNAAILTAPQKFHTVSLYQSNSDLIMRIKRILNNPTQDVSLRPLLNAGLLIFCIFFSYSFVVKDSNAEQTLQSLYLHELPTHEISYKLADIHEMNEVIRNASENNTQATKSKYQLQKLPILGATVQDTTPEDERFKELQKRIEEKSMEIEEMSQRLSERISRTIEIDAKRMEELAKRLEEKMEPLAKEWEEKFMNSEQFKKLENLGEEIGKKIEEKMKDFEWKFDEKKMEELQRRIEEKALQLEEKMSKDQGEVNSAEIEKIKSEMHELSATLRAETAYANASHLYIEEDPEIKRLHQEMDRIRMDLEKAHAGHEDHVMEDEEIKALQEEMRGLQQVMENKIQDAHHEMQHQIQSKSRELEKLSHELAKAHYERAKQQKDN